MSGPKAFLVPFLNHTKQNDKKQNKIEQLGYLQKLDKNKTLRQLLFSQNLNRKLRYLKVFRCVSLSG